MSTMNIKQKEANSIIDSLTAGVVPNIGVQHIVVGRDKEAQAIVEDLQKVKQGQNVMKFWIGDYGSGKSFMIHLMTVLALKEKFVVATADFSPERRLYANDNKALAMYSQLMDSIATQQKPEGGALATIVEKWLMQVINQAAAENGKTAVEIQAPENAGLVEQGIQKSLGELTDIGGFDFGAVLFKYYEGFKTRNDQLKKNALRWLKGEYRIKTEARQDLGVRDIISDQNYYDILKNWSKLFISLGYSGFMINLDEAINLYKIQNPGVREKNYEKLLTLYNDCFQGRSSNMFINVAGTKQFLMDERKGLYSYDALRSRLKPNEYANERFKDFSQPVILLEPIGNEDILILLNNLKNIFDMRYGVEVKVSQDDTVKFMNIMYNKPGAHEFLLPRDVIRQYLNMLNLLRQNADATVEELVGKVEIKKDPNLDLLNEIDVL